MRNAEKWASWAWLDGRPYPAVELKEDWKRVVPVEAHGRSAQVAAALTEKNLKASQLSADRITRSSLKVIADNIDTQGEGIPVVVFNSLAFARSGKVKILATVPYQAGYHFRLLLPHVSGPEYAISHVSWNKETGAAEMDADVSVVGMGYTVYRLVLERDDVVRPDGEIYSAQQPPAPQPEEAGATVHLSGRNIDMQVDKITGCITSLKLFYPGFLKVYSGPPITPYEVELIAPAGCGSQLQAFGDGSGGHSPRRTKLGPSDSPLPMPTHADSVELVGAGTPEPAIRVTYSWQSSKSVETISLNRNSKSVDIDWDIDWQERHATLEAAFPAVRSGGKAVFGPSGVTERPSAHDDLLRDTPASNWADVSGTEPNGKSYGVSVITEAGNSFDIIDGRSWLSLLSGSAQSDPYGRQTRHHFRYALYPHSGTWKEAATVPRSWEYNENLVALSTVSHPAVAQFPSQTVLVGVYRMDPSDTVVITSVRKAEDGDALIVGLYDWAGNDSKLFVTVPPTMTAARLTTSTGKPRGDWLSFGRNLQGYNMRFLPVPIKPYEALTLRLEFSKDDAAAH